MQCAFSLELFQAGGPHNKITYAEAWNECAKMGMRLCTFAELTNDEGKQAGCKRDKELVWAAVGPPKDENKPEETYSCPKLTGEHLVQRGSASHKSSKPLARDAGACRYGVRRISLGHRPCA